MLLDEYVMCFAPDSEEWRPDMKTHWALILAEEHSLTERSAKPFSQAGGRPDSGEHQADLRSGVLGKPDDARMRYEVVSATLFSAGEKPPFGPLSCSAGIQGP